MTKSGDPIAAENYTLALPGQFIINYSYLDPTLGVFGEVMIFPESFGPDILYRKTKILMQNLKHDQRVTCTYFITHFN